MKNQEITPNAPVAPSENAPVASAVSLVLAVLAGTAVLGTAGGLPVTARRFAVIFAELGAPLPLLTQILVGTSPFIFWTGGLLALGLVAGLETMAHKGVAITGHVMVLLALLLLWTLSILALFLPLGVMIETLNGA